MSYVVNCDYNAKRLDEKSYKKRDSISVLFTPIDFDESNPIALALNGNIEIFLNYDAEQRKWNFNRKGSHAFYQVIPSALLLYRLICTFGSNKIYVDGSPASKCIWEYYLKHNETACIVKMHEHKGGASISTNFLDADNMPSSFSKDLLKLLNYISSDDCVHPYGGVVAGSVA